MNSAGGRCAHPTLGLQAGLGDHEHSAHLDNAVKLVSLVIEGDAADLAPLSIQQVAGEELPFASGIGPASQVGLLRDPGLDGPSVLICIEATDGHDSGWSLIACSGPSTASPGGP